MTEKKRRFVSLSVKPLFVLLLGLVLGVCVCLLADFTGEQIIERQYMSEKAILKRTNKAAQEFQSFVRQNGVSTRDTDMLARWGETKKDYYIMLYHDQRQIFEIGWWGADTAAVDAYSLKEQTASVVYPIVFRDGTFYAVIYDNSDSGLYDLLWIVSLLLGCAVLALTLLAYNRRVARRVVAISQEVQSIGAGNLYLQLEPKGRDEISQLTASVEQMRLSLLRKTSEEQRALQQNSDLITAMSHDIRNPLTSLIGYLDLLEMQQAQLPEDLRRYVLASRDKAYQLKDLTGEMFRYFLVFSRGEQETHPEPYDAQILCAQLLGECAEELRSRGFDVNLLLLGTPCTVTTDAQMLKRVTDNLLSNIEKYADPAARLTILAEREGERLHVCFANRARRELARVESNHIGLRTCAAILKLLGGEFVTHRDGDDFTAEFTLPVTPPDAAQSET
mgnify:CR=1 FL=1